MSNVSTNTRKLAEQSAAQAKSTFDKAGAASAEETRRVEQSASTAFNGVREWYLKMLEMAQENTVTGFDFARELASVRSPSELVEVWSAGAREAYGIFSQQTKELSALAQKVATSSAQPLTNGLTNPFRQAQ
jgi:phasin